MAGNYSSTSPYYTTPRNNNKLGLMVKRSFNAEQDDLQYEIDPVYNNRPDLLAYDLYGKPGLWWVFAIRNPDVLVDPVFDFMTGVTIYLPQQATLNNFLEI